MTVIVTLMGRRFGRWSVIERAANDARGKARWFCVCDCGTKRECAGGDLRGGFSQSCGCWKNELAVGRLTKHGHTDNAGWVSKTYISWKGMMQRCYYTANKKFLEYGGRGIRVCKRWHKFENFLADMGERPDGMTLDRWPDNDGDYKRSNCRWATKSQQMLNRRSWKNKR